jgi:Ca2+-binding RTX toxin-like protein
MVQVGTQFNDTFTLGDDTLPAQDTVIGLDASDILTTDDTVGGSVLFGNRDNDSLTSRSTENILYGGQENDRLLSLAGGSLFFGDLGDDLFDAFGGTGKDTVYGGTSDGNQNDGDDVIVFSNASAGSNVGFGNTGDDFLSGSGFGNDTLYGGKGDDTIQVVEVSSSGTGSNTGFAPQNTAISNIKISVTATSGTGTGNGVDVVNESETSAPNNNGKNYLSGDFGKDLIYGIGDRDSLFGGEDTDTLILLGNIANDPNNNLEDNATALNGVPQNAYLDGGAGADSIKAYGGLRGRNTLMGGEGNDTIKNYGVQSYIEGNEGDDTLILENEPDITDEAGTVVTAGTEVYGRSTLMGGTGNDSINSSESGGTNLLWGGDGDDTLVGSSPTQDDGTTPNTDAPGDTLYGDDPAQGAPGADSMTAGTNSLMFGQQGNDILVAAAFGADGAAQAVSQATLYGGQGTDSLLADANATSSYLSGDFGNDTLVTSAANTDATTSNTLDGGEGNDSIYGVGGAFNSLEGGLGNDLILAGILGDGGATPAGNNNTLSGGEGNDTLVAGGVNDTLLGGAGDDWFYGTTGNDTLGYADANNAREGNDSIFGGEGVDYLIGTDGAADAFFYQDSEEIGNADGASADDTITSFETGTDKIYLKSTQFGNTEGDLAGGAGNALRDEEFFRLTTTGEDYITTYNGTFDSGSSTQLPAIVFDANDNGGGTLYWDINGSGATATNTAGDGLLSVIAVIKDGSVQANDIVVF